MKIGIIGCGKIGEKRAKYLGKNLIGCFDIDYDVAIQFHNKFSCGIYDSAENLIDNIDAVIICTTNKALYPNAIKAIEKGKHILIEKPAGINSQEIIDMIRESTRKNIIVQVGFNHRYHPAISKAKEIISNNEIGELMFIRANYGHGGRLGYNKEWRSKKEEGGGELLDQGVHLIDLSSWFLEESSFVKIEGKYKNYFWKTDVEDNGFMMLETLKGKTAFLSVSCTEWKNEFAFDIYGKTGRISIRGLGGSYGTEKITFYKMKPQMGIPDIQSFEYPGEDVSWEIELNKFIDCVKNNNFPEASLYNALTAISTIESIKEESNAQEYTTASTG